MGRVRNITLFALYCCTFLLTLKVQQTNADEAAATMDEMTTITNGDCAKYNDSCNDCLDNKCVWVPGFESCLESCSIIADTACYSPEYFTSNTNEEICTIAENDANDSTLCSYKSDCTSCIDTLLSDGTSTCQWFQGADGPDGYCGSECGMFGCGETTCDTDGNTNNEGNVEEDLFDTTDGASCESYNDSCNDCLDNKCVWVPVEGCMESCDMIADTSCYSPKYFTSNTNEEICTVAENDTNDSTLCSNKSDCTSCIETLLSDGTSTCQWFQGADGLDGYCGSECGMFGCGETTCDTDGNTNNEGNVEEDLFDTTDDGASCESYNDSCNDCLDNKCVWVPVEGCMESCDMIADTSCYSPKYFTSNTNEEICTIAENDTNDSTLCSNKSDCTSCIETLLGDGTSTCQWFQDGPNGYCGSECGMFGCGETVCNIDEGSSIELIGENDCVSKLSCQECLNDESSTCGWVNNGMGCLESCSVVADVPCYDIESFNSYNSIDENNNAETLEMMTGNDICVIADNDVADRDLCESQMDCTSCVETTLVSNPEKSCQWFEFEQVNYCGSGCDMGGCGKTTCDSLTTNDMISLNGSDKAEGAVEISKSPVSNEANNEGNSSSPNFDDDEVTSSATTTFVSVFWFANIAVIYFL